MATRPFSSWGNDSTFEWWFNGTDKDLKVKIAENSFKHLSCTEKTDVFFDDKSDFLEHVRRNAKIPEHINFHKVHYDWCSYAVEGNTEPITAKGVDGKQWQLRVQGLAGAIWRQMEQEGMLFHPVHLQEIVSSYHPTITFVCRPPIWQKEHCHPPLAPSACRGHLRFQGCLGTERLLSGLLDLSVKTAGMSTRLLQTGNGMVFASQA